jgi:DNA-binding NarL/FixJ family response regulator
MKKPVHTIIVIDDHPIIHDGLRTLLASDKNLSITASATTATEALELLETIQPDLAVIDLSLTDSDGAYLIQKINIRYPKLRILVYSMSEEKLFAERVAGVGASGYVMKTSAPETLKEAIQTILAGGIYFSPEIKARVLDRQNGRRINPKSPLENLSNREMDIFKLIGQGFDSAAMAAKLEISRNTADTHRINIKNKLNQESGKALERYAYEVIQQGKLPKK